MKCSLKAASYISLLTRRARRNGRFALGLTYGFGRDGPHLAFMLVIELFAAKDHLSCIVLGMWAPCNVQIFRPKDTLYIYIYKFSIRKSEYVRQETVCVYTPVNHEGSNRTNPDMPTLNRALSYIRPYIYIYTTTYLRTLLIYMVWARWGLMYSLVSTRTLSGDTPLPLALMVMLHIFITQTIKKISYGNTMRTTGRSILEVKQAQLGRKCMKTLHSIFKG